MLRRNATPTADHVHEPGRADDVDAGERHGERVMGDPPVARPSDPGDAAPVVVTGRTSERMAFDASVTRRRFSLASVLGAIAGTAVLVIGVITVVRGGLGGALDEPVVEVVGFAHTPLLGLVDIGFGVLLLLAAATASRSGLTFLGLAAVVAGAVAVAEPEELAGRLAVERAYGWVWLVGGVLVALAAWLLPVYERETRRIDRTDLVT